MKKKEILFIIFIVSLLLVLTSCGDNDNNDGTDGGVGDGSGSLTDDPTANIPDFTLVPLDGLNGSLFTAAVDVNNNVAVGLSNTNASEIRAVRWTLDIQSATASAPTELAPLAGNLYSAAYSVAADGTAAGESEKGTGLAPVLWLTGETVPVELSMFGMGNVGAAFSINASGQIVGKGTTLTGDVVALFWGSATADPIQIGTLGGNSSVAYFIRNDGVIVGEAETALGAFHATFWQVDPNGTVTAGPIDLDAGTGNVSSVAFGINTLSDVVGEMEDASGTVHGVLWHLDGTTVSSIQDLGIPGAVSSAGAVNSSGLITGWSNLTGIDMAAVWKTEGGEITGADTLLGQVGFSQAFSIDDTGLVVGTTGAKAFAAIQE